MFFLRCFLVSALLSGAFLPAANADTMNCGSCATFISSVHGPGGKSPLIPDGATKSPDIVVEAVVTVNTPERLGGFFIQEEVADEDDDPSTSEGLFVYGARPELQPGDRIRAKGVIREFYGQTQMILKELIVCGTNALNEVRPAKPSRKLVLQEMEPYEGMLVHFENMLNITRNYSWDFDSYRNSMDVSLFEPLYKPTQLFPPLSEAAKDLARKNDQNRITLITDERKQENGVISYYPAFGPFIHYPRVGDRIKDLTGVIAYRYGRYEIIPVPSREEPWLAPIDAYALEHEFSPRKGYPTPHSYGTVRIASFNVLNYFNTLMPDHKDNPTGTNRGAKTQEEFELQRTKIIEAVTRIDADVIGLVEVENNGFGTGSAIEDLVSTLNSRLPSSEHYAAVSTHESTTIGTDAITVGLVYKPSRIALHGSLQILTMPEQNFSLTSTDGDEVKFTKDMRPTLLQTFRDKISGKTVTVAVSHFKSKGSMCFEDFMKYATADGKIPLSGNRIKKGSKPTAPDYQDDLQGSCNKFRVTAARHLGDYLQRMGDLLSENILLIGDFNSYGQEDPMRLLTKGKKMVYPVTTSAHTTINCSEVPVETLNRGYGYISLVTANQGNKAYSYCYDGELGALDHAVANRRLAAKVLNIEEWHTNSVENSLFEYPGKYSGNLPKDPGPFSSSDHDPLLIDVDLTL
ncbi:ExeM/NucH family extracellular endonuclease [Sansalvadorimonas sp. 2012CJ34-2]|uniref:ExeM/NucH family extracellular endonuclease n=1 Tax=Parendozoicomonas callyspongiae TaxID=2942213 RepID=A0ABT0PJK4_9GAMM|nr:ExeM/NucH family extracellular endonuclease [Sansalvadorimonas sp. 2012CJ34-2]MCL6271529.1 ExeM/NucH family extracellular endonuclease [Sansalvadorimonas sp. 2012CJ34-2]